MGLKELQEIKKAAYVMKDMPRPVKRKSVNQVSENGKDTKSMLKRLYAVYLAKRTKCKIKSPVCTGEAICVHHTRGRSAQYLLDQETWLPSCVPCNLYVEQYPKWAKERGFIKSKLAK